MSTAPPRSTFPMSTTPRIWTSAGVSAGTDLALAFIAAVAGADAAGIVQYNAEYYPDPRVYGDAIDGADPALYFARR